MISAGKDATRNIGCRNQLLWCLVLQTEQPRAVLALLQLGRGLLPSRLLVFQPLCSSSGPLLLSCSCLVPFCNLEGRWATFSCPPSCNHHPRCGWAGRQARQWVAGVTGQLTGGSRGGWATVQHKEVWALALGRAASILALPLPASPGLLGLSSLSVDNLPQSLFQGLNEGCLKALSTTTA